MFMQIVHSMIESVREWCRKNCCFSYEVGAYSVVDWAALVESGAVDWKMLVECGAVDWKMLVECGVVDWAMLLVDC